MKPVTIAVSVKEPGFAQDLARGLAEQGKHFMIEIPDRKPWKETHGDCQNGPEMNWEVLVTDMGEKDGLKGCFEPSRVVLVREDECRISLLCRRILERVRENRDAEADKKGGVGLGASGWSEETSLLPQSGRNFCHLIAFWSPWGGSGVTALAVTAGRMLAGAYGERALYLPLTLQDGSRVYRGQVGAGKESGDRFFASNRVSPPDRGAVQERGSVQELCYRLKNNRPVSLSDFTQNDEYGLEYLYDWQEMNPLAQISAAEREQFLKKFSEVSDYGWILADGGNGAFPDWADAVVAVENLQDCRTMPLSGEKCDSERVILVRNHGLENRMESLTEGEMTVHEFQDEGKAEWGFTMELIHDGESFLAAEDGSVEIVMSKSYAVGVKNFSERLLETVSNPVETW